MGTECAYSGLSYIQQTNTVRAVAWSPDSKRIASGGDDGTVQVRDVLTGSNEQTYQLL